MSKIEIKSNRKFETSLMGKESVFKILQLAEALGSPVLLIGPPGTGKTKIVTDYTKGMFDFRNQDEIRHFNEDGVFMLETDESTKSSEVKGFVDIEKLVENKKYVVDSPITKADTIIINEVDKASSSLRNSLLGIMNEKILFSGKDKVRCNWRLFVATCNEIPSDEKDSPFWDRFILKIYVNRLSVGEINKYYTKGGRDYTTSIKVNIPTKQEMDSIVVPNFKLEKFLNQSYSKCSDRTLTFVPNMTKAVSLVYKYPIDKALVKTCELLIDKSSASNLVKVLMPPEKREIFDKIDFIRGLNSEEEVEAQMTAIETLTQAHIDSGKLDQDDLNEISEIIEESMKDHPFYNLKLETEVVENLTSDVPLVDLPF